MDGFWSGIFYAALLIVMAAAFLTDFSPAARRCQAAGGRYTLNGECTRIEFHHIDVPPAATERGEREVAGE